MAARLAALKEKRNSPDPSALSWKKFRERPSSIFIDEVAQHIRLTGEPETFDGLYRSKIDSSARYQILRKIDIDQRKRATSDRAPCPMCTPNRFLHGYLVWLPELQIAAVIGHCCADHADDAEREFKAKEQLNQQEDYLLVALPQLLEKFNTLQTLKGAANDAMTLYRRFRLKLPGVQRQLRGFKEYNNAMMKLTEIIGGGEGLEFKSYSGPAGFRGSGNNEILSRDVEFGRISGTTALLSNYRPAIEHGDAVRAVVAFEFTGNEEAALDFITTMTFEQRRAAVALAQDVDLKYEKFIARLKDFVEFWSVENVNRLNAFGTSALNPTPFEAYRSTIQGRAVAVIRQDGEECRIIMPNTLLNLDRDWKVFNYKNR